MNCENRKKKKKKYNIISKCDVLVLEMESTDVP